MMTLPIATEYEPWGAGLIHVPTGIRVELAFQNVEGGWTLNCFLGDSAGYNENSVIQFAGGLLLS